MTAVEWLVQKLNNIYGNNDFIITHINEFQQALEMEKEQKEKVDKLLDTLLVNNMCSHAGDKLIEQFKKENQ